MSVHEISHRRRDRGFSLVEVILVIVILGILSAVAVPAYVSMTKDAEKARVESTVGNLITAVNIAVMKQVTAGQTPAAHNPFDDLATRPNNYAGAFPDVDLSNCPAGKWAFQTGNAANANWAIVVYRFKSTPTTAFSWGGAKWLVYEIKTVTDASGKVTSLSVTEYPPLHVW